MVTSYFSTIFVILLVNVTLTVQTDYCKLPCGKNVHTVCRRKNVNCGRSPSCGSSYKQIQLTDSDRRFLLDTHNTLRNKVATGQEKMGPQPSASNMKALSYNKEHEYIAQCLTNTCQFKHDKCRRTKAYGWVGQNLFIKKFKGTPGDVRSVISSGIQSWYNEVKHFNPAWVTKFGHYGKNVGHYTQQLWADTQDMGCALTFYVDAEGWNTYLMACNYGPGGNILGQPVYKKGSPASNCGKLSVNSKFHGLCGPDKI